MCCSSHTVLKLAVFRLAGGSGCFQDLLDLEVTGIRFREISILHSFHRRVSVLPLPLPATELLPLSLRGGGTAAAVILLLASCEPSSTGGSGCCKWTAVSGSAMVSSECSFFLV